MWGLFSCDWPKAKCSVSANVTSVPNFIINSWTDSTFSHEPTSSAGRNQRAWTGYCPRFAAGSRLNHQTKTLSAAAGEFSNGFRAASVPLRPCSMANAATGVGDSMKNRFPLFPRSIFLYVRVTWVSRTVLKQ